MAIYQIYQFDSAPLPLYNPEQELSSPAVRSTLLASVGGRFDRAGTRRELPSSHQITVRGIFESSEVVYLVDHAGNHIKDHNNNRIIVATALGYLRGQQAALQGKLGSRGTLYRKRWDDTTVTQWKTARLHNLRQYQDYKHHINVVDLDCVFESTMVAWRSAAAITDSGTLVSGGFVGVNVAPSGDVGADDAVLAVTAGGAITSVTIACPAIGVDLAWAGSLASGQALIIDCGAQTIRADGVDVYSGLSRGSAHTADGWLPLALGVNALVIGANGAGTVAVSHYDQFL